MFEELLDSQNSWINKEETFEGVVFSSRLRLARNLADFFFPPRLSKPGLRLLLDKFENMNTFLGGQKKFFFADVSELSKQDKEFLLERHLVSRHFIFLKEGGVFFSLDESTSVMINEEDHIRLQVVEPGYNLKKGWERLSKIDDRVSTYFDYAFLPDLGYLTSCPTNVGTGLRASCMVHLPGLILAKKIEKVLSFLEDLSFTIRGLFGEGSQALGDFFQISNQVSLGLREEELIDNLEGVVVKVSQQELDARQLLLKKFKTNLEDIAWRALGVLRNSRLIDCKEALKHLSTLSLGVDLGIIKGVEKRIVNNLFTIIQPAHLQKRQDKPLNQRERDYLRAELLREKLN